MVMPVSQDSGGCSLSKGFPLPQVLLTIGFLTAIPYFIAAIGMVIAGRHSDQTAERILQVSLPLFVSGAAFARSAHASSRYAGPLACHARHLCRHRHVLVAADSILTGTGAAAGLALINSIGNCGGFAGPVIVGQLKGATGDFTGALPFLAGAPRIAFRPYRGEAAAKPGRDIANFTYRVIT